MPTIEEYLENADELAQRVINTWGPAFPARLSPEFDYLLDKTCKYRTAKDIADNRREFDSLPKQDEDREITSRLDFAKAYKAFYERPGWRVLAD